MIKLKKALAVGTMALTIGAMSLTAFAASNYKTPAEAAAGVTGKTVESVTHEKAETGKTYGTIAKDAGKLDEFKKENLEMKKDNLKSQVESGKITQEKADEIIKAVEKNQAECDGSGSAKIGQHMGARFGSNGEGQGNGGANRGKGQGRGQNGGGRGLGNRAGASK
ncbi:hypothetical protein [Clostridium oceanicum]|uniref:DUF2680 domain-containing protein n=1 Tax=Clostridium oceanicum TaxID=1543 RepID=A0ABN1JTV4_9CLOT